MERQNRSRTSDNTENFQNDSVDKRDRRETYEYPDGVRGTVLKKVRCLPKLSEKFLTLTAISIEASAGIGWQTALCVEAKSFMDKWLLSPDFKVVNNMVWVLKVETQTQEKRFPADCHLRTLGPCSDSMMALWLKVRNGHWLTKSSHWNCSDFEKVGRS